MALVEVDPSHVAMLLFQVLADTEDERAVYDRLTQRMIDSVSLARPATRPTTAP